MAKPFSEISLYLLRHLPSHLLDLESWDEVEDLLTDIRFLEARAQSGLIFELVTDFLLTLEQLDSARPRYRLLSLIGEALRHNAMFAGEHPACLFQQLWNHGWWHDGPDSSRCLVPKNLDESALSRRCEPCARFSDLVERWRAEKRCVNETTAWLRVLSPPSNPVGEGQPMTLRTHVSTRALRFSNEGEWIHICSSLELATCSLSDGQVAHSVDVDVDIAVFSRDGRTLAGVDSHAIRAWDVATGRCKACITLVAGEIGSIALSPDGMAIAFVLDEREVCVRSIHTRGAEQSYRFDDAITAVTFVDDRGVVACASADGVLTFIDAARSSALRTHRIRLRGLSHITAPPDGRVLAVATLYGIVALVNAETGELLIKRKVHDLWTNSLAFSPDGKYLVSASGDGVVAVSSVPHFGRHARVESVDDEVECAAISPCNQRIVTGSADGWVRVFSLPDADGRGGISRHKAMITHLLFTRRGTRLISGAGDGEICVWCSATGRLIHRLCGHSTVIESLAISPSSDTLVSASADHTVRVWDIVSGSEISCFAQHKGGVNCAVFAADGKTVASASDDGTIRVWDCYSGTELSCLRASTTMVKSVALFEHEPLALSLDYGGKLLVLGLQDGEPRLDLTPTTDGLATAVVLSRDEGTVFASTLTEVMRICLRDATTSRIVASHGDIISQWALSSDERRIATKDDEKRVALWDSYTGNCLETGWGNCELDSLTEGPIAYPFQAVESSNCIAIQHSLTGHDVAFFPEHDFDRLVVAPTGTEWAASRGRELLMFRLEDAKAGPHCGSRAKADVPGQASGYETQHRLGRRPAIRWMRRSGPHGPRNCSTCKQELGEMFVKWNGGLLCMACLALALDELAENECLSCWSDDEILRALSGKGSVVARWTVLSQAVAAHRLLYTRSPKRVERWKTLLARNLGYRSPKRISCCLQGLAVIACAKVGRAMLPTLKHECRPYPRSLYTNTIRAVGLIDPKDPFFERMLQKAARDRRAGVRVAAAEISREAEADWAEKLIESLSNDPNPSVRRATCRGEDGGSDSAKE